MSRTSQIAVFGAGLVGARHVEEAARQARIAAIVDPSPAAKALAEKHGTLYFDTPEACLDAIRPDGVVVATPNHLHAEHSLACISNGIPVLIEKPIADTAVNAARITAASAEKDVPVLIGHHRRHNPLIQRAKAAIGEGMIGDMVAVTGQFWLYKPDDYFDQSWRRAPGAGPLLINLIHDVDLLRYLCGEITEVQAMRSNHARGHDVEDTAALLMRFEDGVLGTFSVSDSISAPWSWEMTAAENPVYPHVTAGAYRIGGTAGSLSIPDLTLWAHTGVRSWWEDIGSQKLIASEGDAFRLQFAHFLDVIDGTPPLVSASEGSASLSVVLKAVAAELPS